MFRSPVWLAVMVQVPVASAVSIVPLVPLVVQVAGVVDANTTGLFVGGVGVATALKVSVLPTWKAMVAAGLKLVMVCATLVMVKLSVTCGAAA